MNLLKAYLIFAGTLLAGHCVFHILYLNVAAPWLAWLTALRYLAATTAAALLLPGLAYLISVRRPGIRRFILWLAGIVIYYCFTVLVGDLAYYRQAGKHSTIELLLFYQNFTDVASMALRNYAYVPLLYLVSAVAFFWFWRKLVAKEKRDPSGPALSGRFFIRRIFIVVAFVLASIIAIRGGFRGRPMRPADAFQHLTQTQGDFALNGIYTSFYAMFHRSGFPVKNTESDIAAVRSLLKNTGEVFPSPDLPFFRKTAAQTALKKNVVFIILESWSARRLGVFGDKAGATPFFDSLAHKGWLFTNAFATGRRSIASLPAAVSSIPTLFGSLYITSPHEQNFQRGIGQIFREQGYETFFTYAAKAGSMGFNAFARLAGFEHIITRESFPANAAHDGTWGIYDHVMFARAIGELNAAKKPFLSVIYTLHPHPPFTVPDGNAYYSADFPRGKYYNALRYSDNTLRDFFAAAERSPWFKDTVFVLMADHAFEDIQGRAAFHIPLLIYAPGFVSPKSDARIASELDVLPTLVDLLQLETTHAAMGVSLLRPQNHFAFIDLEHAGGVITDAGGETLLLVFNGEKFTGYHNLGRDPELRQLQQKPPVDTVTLKSFESYLGVMGHAIQANRIGPGKSHSR